MSLFLLFISFVLVLADQLSKYLAQYYGQIALNQALALDLSLGFVNSHVNVISLFISLFFLLILNYVIYKQVNNLKDVRAFFYESFGRKKYEQDDNQKQEQDYYQKSGQGRDLDNDKKNNLEESSIWNRDRKNGRSNWGSGLNILRSNRHLHFFLALNLVNAGAISNVIDRFIHGGVRDWLRLPVLNLHNNLADIYIFFGSIILMILLMQHDKEMANHGIKAESV